MRGWGRLSRRSVRAVGTGLIALLGLWLIAAPLLLNFGGHRLAVANHVVAGVRQAPPAVVACWDDEAIDWPRWFAWLPPALGLWLLISPWVFGPIALPAIPWDDLLIGALTLVAGG